MSLSTLLSPTGGGLPPRDAASLLDGKVVLLALPPPALTPAVLAAQGARDVLMLTPAGDEAARRHGDHVRQRYRQLSDVRKNNCQVALLHGRSALALAEKAKFARFSHVLVPAGPGALAAAVGLLRYGRRGGLSLAGRTRIEAGGRTFTYLVLATSLPVRDNRRQYGPTGLAPADILREIADLDQVVLRWSEDIEAGRHSGDMDILVSAAHVAALRDRFSRTVSTYPLDVYTDDGSGGYAYKSVPYFIPDMARRILASGSVGAGGLRVAEPRWRLLSFCYHLLFHNKSERVAPGTTAIARETFHSPHYYDELVRLSALAGQPVPRTFDDIEALLKGAQCFPSLDLIGFYSRKNAFLKRRYFEGGGLRPGLATFFVRDFGQGADVIAEVRASLLRHFEILAEGPVTPDLREAVLSGVRGGNWTDPQAPGGRAEPIYWLVCWDKAPRAPSRATRRKHPRVDNEHVRIKDAIRSAVGNGGRKVQPIVHSSDNAHEALDHLAHLGLTQHPAVLTRLSAAPKA